MSSTPTGLPLRELRLLFSEGTLAGFSDAQLMERFTTQHDAAAFEALMHRHGPMVLAVCRGVPQGSPRHPGCISGDLPGPGPHRHIRSGPSRDRWEAGSIAWRTGISIQTNTASMPPAADRKAGRRDGSSAMGEKCPAAT